jgi:hypothetical protein
MCDFDEDCKCFYFFTGYCKYNRYTACFLRQTRDDLHNGYWAYNYVRRFYRHVINDYSELPLTFKSYQQGMLTPPWHLIPPLIYSEERTHSLIFISYKTYEIDYWSLFLSFHSLYYSFPILVSKTLNITCTDVREQVYMFVYRWTCTSARVTVDLNVFEFIFRNTTSWPREPSTQRTSVSSATNSILVRPSENY